MIIYVILDERKSLLLGMNFFETGSCDLEADLFDFEADSHALEFILFDFKAYSCDFIVDLCIFEDYS